jgi:integrase
MSALAVHELPVIERARMIREARALEEAAVRDKTYQATTLMGPDIRYWLQTLQFQGSPATTIATYELPWAWLAVEYADYRMADFCTSEGVPILRDFLTRHWGDAAVDTRRNRLYALRSGFQWGVDERDLPWNPAGRIKPPKAGETLRIAHTQSEVTRLLASQDSLRDQCALGLFVRLALRKNDVRMLQIRDIDLSREQVWLRHRKGGEDLLLPIGDQRVRDDLYLHIQGERRQPAEYLLYPKNHTNRPLDSSSLHRWFKRCLERADLPDFPLHELRHTAGDEMWRATGNLVLAQQLLGHKSLAATQRYLHPSPEDLRAAMRLVAANRGEET